jgi:hypothetical protein
MRPLLIFVLASGLLLAGCAQAADGPVALASPAAPTAGLGSDSQAAAAPGAKSVEMPFHSEVTWAKSEGSLVSLCTHPLPAGKVYLARNTITGTAISTHLGAGEYEGHTCVYGPPGGPFQGWFGDVRWTAANGDVLLATSEFLRWTGTPGQSIAIEAATFLDGGTGRFRYAEGTAETQVNAPGRTAEYNGALRYGNKEK